MSNTVIFLIVVGIVLVCSSWFWKLLAGLTHLVAIVLFLAIFVWAFKEATTPINNCNINFKENCIVAPKEIIPFVKEAAKKYNIGVDTILALIQIESGFDKYAISYTGAQGLMQLMPATQESVGVIDPYDPEQNIMGGTKYLSWQFKRFKNLDLALAAYYAGPEIVREAEGYIPFCAETYVAVVKQNIEARNGNKESTE